MQEITHYRSLAGDRRVYEAYRDDLHRIFVDDPHGANSASITDILRRFALAGDGMVDKFAFLSAIKRMGVHVHGDQRWPQLFHLFDPKKQGKADVELVAALLSFWQQTFGAVGQEQLVSGSTSGEGVSVRGNAADNRLNGIWNHLAQKKGANIQITSLHLYQNC